MKIFKNNISSLKTFLKISCKPFTEQENEWLCVCMSHTQFLNYLQYVPPEMHLIFETIFKHSENQFLFFVCAESH